MSDPPAVDRQRRAVYDAERFAFEGSWLWARLPRARATALARTVVADAAWRRLHAQPITFVGTGRRHSFCSADGRIGFGPEVELCTIAHELAHAVVHARLPHAAGHGPEWRGWNVTIVGLLHGDEAADGLADAFATYGLEVVRPAVEWSGRPLLAETDLAGS